MYIYSYTDTHNLRIIKKVNLKKHNYEARKQVLRMFLWQTNKETQELSNMNFSQDTLHLCISILLLFNEEVFVVPFPPLTAVLSNLPHVCESCTDSRSLLHFSSDPTYVKGDVPENMTACPGTTRHRGKLGSCREGKGLPLISQCFARQWEEVDPWQWEDVYLLPCMTSFKAFPRSLLPRRD